ncbi:MAG: hypothetical protein Fur0039_21950 [Rhodocyclaceae bacterium]
MTLAGKRASLADPEIRAKSLLEVRRALKGMALSLTRPRMPDPDTATPPCLFGQPLSALRAESAQWRAERRVATPRRELDATGFLGQIDGWAPGPRTAGQ